jgi:hypothetical protein
MGKFVGHEGLSFYPEIIAISKLSRIWKFINIVGLCGKPSHPAKTSI